MKTGVVIVTYNRLEKLKKCLAAYKAQTVLPKYMIIVDNCSTDGTKEFLEEWSKREQSISDPFQKIIVRTEKNLGGAGGFVFGISHALKLEEKNIKESNRDFWIWLADDDAYPEPDCFEKIASYYNSLNKEEQQKTAALCAKVVDNNGISPLHRRCLKYFQLQVKEIPLSEEDYQKKEVSVDFFSFVGTAIRKDVIQRIGLPYADYFIFYDDSEYSLRVKKEGVIRCISDAVILHDSLENTISKYSWKNYYMFRNKMYTYQMYFSPFYCFVDRVKIIYMIWKFYNTKESWQQYRKARKDVKAGKLGVCEEYLP